MRSAALAMLAITLTGLSASADADILRSVEVRGRYAVGTVEPARDYWSNAGGVSVSLLFEAHPRAQVLICAHYGHRAFTGEPQFYHPERHVISLDGGPTRSYGFSLEHRLLDHRFASAARTFMFVEVGALQVESSDVFMDFWCESVGSETVYTGIATRGSAWTSGFMSLGLGCTYEIAPLARLVGRAGFSGATDADGPLVLVSVGLQLPLGSSGTTRG
ncbi:MAG: hypothetical protein KAW67_04245, partial [Candidatus Eisenbacteria sp.]|nr:hypothetical protein [Candidatus Eisenbacteria bacterium]